MHRKFDSHTRAILDRHKPKTLLEIGVLHGQHTLRILEWCEENGASLTSVDPAPWEGEIPGELKQGEPGWVYKRGVDGFDGWVVVPMQGMTQSLNVSVAAGIILGEAFRQRLAAGAYEPHWDEARARGYEAWVQRDRAKRLRGVPPSSED